jgi:hypothetical protein
MMEKKHVAERLAAKAKLPPAEAADQLDTVIHNLLKAMRSAGARQRANALQRLIEEARPVRDGRGGRAE